MQSKEASTDIVYKKKKRLAKSGKDMPFAVSMAFVALPC